MNDDGMKLVIKARSLGQSLSKMAKVVKPNTAIPILGYVHIQTHTTDTVMVSGTDHRTYYRMVVPCEEVSDNFDLMLNLNETHSMMNKLDTGALVEFNYSEDSERITISAGNSTWRRESRPGVEFPKFPETTEDLFQELSATRLSEVLTSAMRATPKRVTFNPGLTQIWIHDGQIDSGDGMWYQRIDVPELNHIDTTIPTSGVKTLLAILRGWGDVSVKMGHTPTHVVVRSDDQVVGISINANLFPDISPYLDDPKISHTEELSVIVKEFDSALRQVSLSADKERGTVRMDLTMTSIKMTAKSLEGDAQIYCSCSWEGKDRTVFVDWRNLIGVIAASGAKEKLIIKFGVDTARNPSTLYIEEADFRAAIVQQRGR